MLNARRQRVAGFNLIELMLAVTLGLIVTGAVVAFIASTIQSNGAMVRSTRLTQELRALTELVARDIRRARSTADPLTNIGVACSNNPGAANPCTGLAIMQSLNTATPGCILFGYEGALGGNFRMIRREVTGGIGSLVISAGNAAQTCATAGTTLSSPIIDITEFTITQVGNSQINLELEGRMRNDANDVRQSFLTSVYIRSGGI